MNDKERLEDIIQDYLEEYEAGNVITHYQISAADFNWFVEQAERAEELKVNIKYLKASLDSTKEIIRHSESKDVAINKLHKQNKCYHEILEYVQSETEYSPLGEIHTAIRKALDGESE